jgi:hypothetical protein
MFTVENSYINVFIFGDKLLITSSFIIVLTKSNINAGASFY